MATAPAESGWASMLPKSETAALEFVTKNPKGDGRGVLVAVFDTGVDPGAPGLSTTTDGKPKIVDIIDCTGDGDVKTTTKRQAAVEPGITIDGLSGRALKLNPDWCNPTGEWRVGIKRGYELFPKPLKNRLTKDAKKLWDEKNAAAIAMVTQAISDWTKDHPDTAVASADAIRCKQDLDARYDYLKSISYDDPGPIYDIVVWHDGSVWRGAVDTREDGNLTDAIGLSSYKLEQKYGSFGATIQMNYVLTVYEDGDVCNICCDSGSHGTHVAGIIGAYRPDDPALNGVAPGCQIISCKIGDIRLDTMETSKSLIRALAEAVSHKVDLINMSFGETTSVANKGFFVKLADDVVNKHNCIFLSSAGNAGPALSTAGAPGASSDCIIGIGAYVSAAMMKTCYSMPQSKVDGYETKFTWTSVGPALDGGAGADITAPGGAITCVPNWTLAKSQLMNGTSMSSPNACGNTALLLSVLKSQSIGYSKHRIQRALCNTARHLDNCAIRGQGTGLLQVDSALENLLKFKDDPIEDVEFRIATFSSGKNPEGGRGVYLRDASQMDAESLHWITVTPIFHEDAPKRNLIDFEMKVAIESDVEWVSVPQQFVVAAKERDFKAFVNPTALAPGVHYGHIIGRDATTADRLPLFRVPVTVTKPFPESPHRDLGLISISRGTIKRFFFSPPPGSTWMDIIVKRPANCSGSPGSTIVVLHTMQLLLNRSYKHGETKNYLRLKPGDYDVISRKIDGQSTVEVCTALYWSELQSVNIDVSATFNALSPSVSTAVIGPGAGFARVELSAPLCDVPVNLSAKLSTWSRPLRPTSASFYPLSERHNLLDGAKLHELMLVYEITIEESSSITVRFEALQNKVYEAELIGGPMVMVFDSRKKLLGCGDLYTSPIKVPKGKVTIRAFLRHTNATLLKSYESISAVIERSMTKPAQLKTYFSVGEMNAQRAEYKKGTVRKGSLSTVYIKEPDYDQLPKESMPGDFFSGNVTYEKEAAGKLGEGSRPGGYYVKYFAGGAPKADVEHKLPGVEDTRDECSKLKDAVKDLTIKTLKGLSGKEGFQAIYSQAVADYPDDLEVTQCWLHHIDQDGTSKESLDATIAAADTVIQMIDQDELAAFFGVNRDMDNPLEVAEKEKQNKKKACLVDALNRKALACAKVPVDGKSGSFESFEEAIKSLKRWTNVNDDSHLKLNLKVYQLRNQHGLALRAVDKALQNNDGPIDSQNRDFRQTLLGSALGFSHVADYMERWNIINSPPDYPLP